ncbi:hypothetical protein HYE29_03910 [Mycoplasmopsis bovis]|nr:hypothetical protein [Mycoplasmopsis bovis]QQH22870.1 hypothetical protein HYE29_03910 [Mycoplasmopsis bovis]
MTGNDLGKSTELLNKIKATKKKLKPLYKEAIVTKVPDTKRQGIKIKRWFKQEKRNCFC